MKKLFKYALILVLAITAFGCSSKTSFSYTYKVSTGDQVKITLDTTNGHKMTSETPFAISLDDKVITQGDFLQKSGYDYYKTAVSADPNVTEIEKKTKDNIEYVFWNFDNQEFNYVIYIKDSNTCIILGNTTSKESAQEIFNLLSFELE